MSRSPGAVLALAAAAQAAVSLVNFGLPSIGPELAEDYGLTLFELGAVLTAGLLGAGLSLMGAGVAVDRIGARAAMLAGTAVAVLGLGAASASESKGVLFAAMLVFGVGSAAVPVAGAGALFDAYPTARRGWALGVRQTAVPLGGTIAAVAYPALHALGGTPLALTASLAAVGLTGAAFAAVAPGRIVRPHVEQQPFRTILRAPGMRRLLLVAACYILVLQALLAYAVPTIRASGQSELVAAVAYFAINVAAMIARIGWGLVADRGGGTRRARTLVEVGLVACAGGIAFTAALHTSASLIVAAAFVFGIGALGWNALVYVSAGERVDLALAGRSVAVAATVVFVLSGVLTPTLGVIADTAGWDALWLTTAVVAGLGALLAAGLSPRALR